MKSYNKNKITTTIMNILNLKMIVISFSNIK